MNMCLAFDEIGSTPLVALNQVECFLAKKSSWDEEWIISKGIGFGIVERLGLEGASVVSLIGNRWRKKC
ncbi:hypothetical protein AgCh_012875 [Apium graveolens]